MSLEQADRRLDELRTASERIGGNLLELELDPTRRLLDEVSLQGSSAAAWAAASARLMQLWQWHGLLDTHVDRAAKLRGTRTHLRPDQLAGLDELLRGASIAVELEDVPLEERDLIGASSRIARFSADDLIAHMSSLFDEVKETVASFADAWDLEPRLRAIGALRAEISDLGSSLSEMESAEITEDGRRIAALEHALRNDPLSVITDEIERIERSLQSRRADLDELSSFCSSVDEHLRRAGELLNALIRTQRECQAAHHEVLSKVCAPTVREPLALGADITAELDQAAELAKAGAWREAQQALFEWRAQATSKLNETKRIMAENRTPIEERNQLRGLLNAYRAKAVKHGLAEDADLSNTFGRAQAVLYTAPTDLAEAGRLVRLCQLRLRGNHPRGRTES